MRERNLPPGNDEAKRAGTPIEELLTRRLTRAQALLGLGGVAAVGALGGLAAAGPAFGRSLDTTTISMWGNHPEWKPVLDQIVKDFEQSHPTIKVDLSYKPGPDYTAALNTALAGGAAPDVIGWIEGTTIRTGAKAKQIIPLDGKVPVNNLIPAAKAQVDFAGHAWGSPLAAYTVGVYYQRPIFKKYGIKPPTTWAELTAVSQKLLDNGVTPWSMPAKDMIIPYFFYHMAATSILGLQGFTDLRKGKRKLTEPAIVKAAQLMIDLEKFYNSGYQAVAYAEGKALFAQGQTAMIIGGSADFTGYKQVNPKVDVGVFGFPSPKGGSHVTVTGMELLYTVNAKSSHPNEATTLVSWLSSKTAQQQVADKLARPIATGVVPSTNNRVGREMVLAGKPDIPVWFDLPETGLTLDAVIKASGIFTGDLTAQQFAQRIQASIKPNPNL